MLTIVERTEATKKNSSITIIRVRMVFYFYLHTCCSDGIVLNKNSTSTLFLLSRRRLLHFSSVRFGSAKKELPPQLEQSARLCVQEQYKWKKNTLCVWESHVLFNSLHNCCVEESFYCKYAVAQLCFLTLLAPERICYFFAWNSNLTCRMFFFLVISLLHRQV